MNFKTHFDVFNSYSEGASYPPTCTLVLVMWFHNKHYVDISVSHYKPTINTVALVNNQGQEEHPSQS